MYAEVEGNDVKLYGSIYYGDGQYVVSAISKLLAQTKAPVTIHLHTPGGSVFDGNLIYNAIANAKANVTVQIDGLAASMGSIIMLAGKTVQMAENAFIMIHAPSGSTQGNADNFEKTAKLLRSLESNFIKKLGAKTSASAEEIAKWMNGDNWFSAEEAKTAGLVDSIIDPVLEDNPDVSAFQDLQLCATLFATYDKKQTTPKNSINPKNKEMKLTAESLTILGLSESATEQEINAAIDSNNKKIQALEQEKQDGLKARAKKLVAEAVASGRILGSEAEAYEADANSNYDLTERMLGKLQAKSNLAGTEKHEAPTGTGREKWTFNEWRKQDAKGLVDMKEKDPEAYKALMINSSIKH